MVGVSPLLFVDPWLYEESEWFLVNFVAMPKLLIDFGVMVIAGQSLIG